MNTFEFEHASDSSKESRELAVELARIAPHIMQALGATGGVFAVMTPAGLYAVSRATLPGYEGQLELLARHCAELKPLAPIALPPAPNVH